MGKKKNKPKKKCCGKYRKEGKHCKRCPILFKLKKREQAEKKKKKKADKEKKKKSRKKDKKK